MNPFPGYTLQVALRQTSAGQFLALCEKAAGQNGWEVQNLSAQKIIIIVPQAGNLQGERLTVVLEGDAAILTSTTINGDDDEAKNRRNIETLLATVDELWRKGAQGIADEPAGGFLGTLKFLLTPRKEYWLTPVIFLINVAAFIATLVDGAHILMPDIEIMLRWGANYSGYTLNGEWWRIITACFLHYGILHLLFNMYGLLYLGIMLEPSIGRLRFGIAYLLAGVGGNIASLYFNPMAVGVGASGAIFGMLGVLLALLTTKLIDKRIRGPLLNNMLFVVGINLMLGFTVKNIDNAAHIGGLLTGMAAGYVMYFDFRTRLKTRKNAFFASAAGMAALAVVLYFAFLFIPGAVAEFEKNRMKFVEIENQAFELYAAAEKMNDAQEAEALQKILVLWGEARQLMENTDTAQLPGEMMKLRKALVQYSILRQEQFELIARGEAEGTGRYNDVIKQYNTRIDSLLKANNLADSTKQ